MNTGKQGKRSERKSLDFKTGDRVIVVCTCFGFLPLGLTGTVVSPGGTMYIDWDSKETKPSRGPFYCWRFDFAGPAECIYCGAETEVSNKYTVCTECYRVQED